MFLLFGGLLFTGDITTDKGALVEISPNSTDIEKVTRFVFEKSIYVYVHHTMNFLLQEFFLGFILSFLPIRMGGMFFSDVTMQVTTKMTYVGSFLMDLGGAALWEVVEKFFCGFFIVMAAWTAWVPFVFMKNFFNTGEDIWNTLLSDLPQAMSASLGRMFLFYTTQEKPLAFLVHTRSAWRSFFLFVWYLVSVGCAVIAVFKTTYPSAPSVLVPYGLFSYLWLQVFFLVVMYWSDSRLIQKEIVLTKNKIRERYILMFVYVMMIGASTCFLVVPGLITSNFFFWVFYVFGSYVYFKNKRQQ
jgi:hypothetical protein